MSLAVRLIDIHGGGNDLKFPHHENEVAQARMSWDTSLANTWVHNGMINIADENHEINKMSKSLGNVLLAKDLIDQYSGPVCRLMLISTHYRAPLTISKEALESSAREIAKIRKPAAQALFQLDLADAFDPNAEKDEASWNAFMDAMADDLNTPNAISALQAAHQGTQRCAAQAGTGLQASECAFTPPLPVCFMYWDSIWICITQRMNRRICIAPGKQL